jgi:hypothetical protein
MLSTVSTLGTADGLWTEQEHVEAVQELFKKMMMKSHYSPPGQGPMVELNYDVSTCRSGYAIDRVST